MIDQIRSFVRDIELRLPELSVLRANSNDGLVDDIAETADYCTVIGRSALQKDTRVNYPARAGAELQTVAKLRIPLAKRATNVQSVCGSLLDVCEQILRLLRKIEVPKDGYRSVLKIIRNNFKFLETEYGFALTAEEPTWARYSSGAVYIRLRYDLRASDSCVFGQEPEGGESFEIRDVFFLYSDERYLTTPETLTLDTDDDLKSWFAFLASAFHEYGGELLSNRPGVFARLKNAQTMRDTEIALANEKYFKSSLPK